MTAREFIIFREQLLNECAVILDTKGRDYTKGNVDRLANFKEGQDLGLTPLQCIGMYLMKHNNSIYSYIRSGGQNESEPIRERIKDAINYLTLTAALIEDSNV